MVHPWSYHGLPTVWQNLVKKTKRVQRILGQLTAVLMEFYFFEKLYLIPNELEWPDVFDPSTVFLTAFEKDSDKLITSGHLLFFLHLNHTYVGSFGRLVFKAVCNQLNLFSIVFSLQKITQTNYPSGTSRKINLNVKAHCQLPPQWSISEEFREVLQGALHTNPNWSFHTGFHTISKTLYALMQQPWKSWSTFLISVLKEPFNEQNSLDAKSPLRSLFFRFSGTLDPSLLNSVPLHQIEIL